MNDRDEMVYKYLFLLFGESSLSIGRGKKYTRPTSNDIIYYE